MTLLNTLILSQHKEIVKKTLIHFGLCGKIN